jgi:hypothetical protein
MTRRLPYFLLGMWIGIVLIISILFGCSALPPINSKIDDCDTHPSGWCRHYSAQSWDQEHLKARDSGCPTAIYDAPGGNLRLCPVLP